VRAAALVSLLLALPAWASEADIQSSACRDALAALQAHEATMGAASAPGRPDRAPIAAADATWRALRAKAAHLCLGGAPDAPPPPPRGATVPIAVPSVTAGSAPPLPATRALTSPLPTRTPPVGVTLCDGSGCWTHDGERLPQVGRSPFDPRVHCSVQGRVVVCQ